MADGVSPPAMAPKLGDAAPVEGRTGALRRVGLLVLALLFQIVTFLALFVSIHILRGHYEGSTYSTAQQIDAAVLGLPGAVLGLGVLLAALYTLFSGRRPGLVFRLMLASTVLLAVGYGLELALK